MDLFQSIIIVSVSSASNNLVYRLLAVTIIAQTNPSVMSASTGVMTITTATTHSPTSSKEVGEEHWNYEDTDGWTSKYRDCAGEFQSPINIDPGSAIREFYPRMIFGNYNLLAAENITNNGHTVLLHLPNNFPAEQLPFIMAGGLKDRYNFVQLHFHWGGDSTRGSEHLIGFKRYVGELHIVHYNSKYGSFSEASKHSDGLAVLGVLIELGQRDNIAMRHIVNQFQQVIHSGEETNLFSPIPIGDLLPDNVNNFYRYTGSLTTPGCQEIVLWTIFDTPISVSERQLAQFRQLFDSEGHVMKDNFRPVHLRHGRIITYRSEDGQPLIRNHHSGPAPLVRQRLPQAIESDDDDDWKRVLEEYFYNSKVPETIISSSTTDIDINNNWQDFEHSNLIGTASDKGDGQNNYYENSGIENDEVNSEYSLYRSANFDEQSKFSQSAADNYLSFLSQISQLRSRHL